jgi:hypothetical protein
MFVGFTLFKTASIISNVIPYTKKGKKRGKKRKKKGKATNNQEISWS